VWRSTQARRERGRVYHQVMTLQHLSPKGNEEVARLLLGAAKTIFAASVVALFFPQMTETRPYMWALAGMLSAAALGALGIIILERERKPEGQSRQKGR